MSALAPQAVVQDIVLECNAQGSSTPWTFFNVPNYNLGGLAVQRAGVQMQAYTAFIKDHLDIAQSYIKMLHQWFWVMNPDTFQGWTEQGTPVKYWAVSNPRYG